jgi:N-methylhydantoinase B
MATVEEPTTAVVEEIVWDGKVHSYRPQPDWLERVSPKVKLHQEVAEEIDPVTFEVIRNRLWSSNLAHGETLARISGSPVFQALDFNLGICTEDAELVINAPFIQNLSLGAPLAMRYIMESLGENPGIDEGDIFVTNDCWIGAIHQMDVLVAAPVFVDGRIFAWVSNAGHQYDLGGNTPGGWTQNATDVFQDPVMFSPFKLVEAGVLREDLDRMYCRHSRVPELVALDLRAQLSGVRYAAREIKAACEEFGASTVKAAMRRILDNAERSFREKMERIPDGTWSETYYVDEKVPGDRHVYRLQFNLKKQGDHLIVDNKGTDPQEDGPIGFVFAAFLGGVFGGIATSLLSEHLFAVGGAERAIELNPTPGLLNCIDWPAPVAGGVMNSTGHMVTISAALARMMSCDPELKDEIVGPQNGWANLTLDAINDRGEYQGTGLFESTAAGSSGKWNRDGTDTNGVNWSPLMPLLNAEELEQYFPLVYLYRYERPDGGGAGRFRGGTGLDVALSPYRSREFRPATNVAGAGVSTSGSNAGLMGGYPVPTTRFMLRSHTNLLQLFSERQMLTDVEDLQAGESKLLRGKSDADTEMVPGDVLEFSFGGGAGFGDPLQREPARVAVDVDLGYQSVEAAKLAYGVVIAEDGSVDEAATADLRADILARRAQWQPASAIGAEHPVIDQTTPASGEPPRHVHEYVVARDEGEQRVLACSECSTVLSDYRGDYKMGMLVDDESPERVIPTNADPSTFLDDPMVFRRFCCPGCQVLMKGEIVRRGDKVFSDLILD